MLKRQKYGKFKRAIALAVIQLFMSADLSMAGQVIDLQNNLIDKNTLSPQLNLDADSFRQSYSSYLFWSEHLVNLEPLPFSSYDSAQKTFEALMLIPAQYRSVEFLQKEYVQGGNPILYRAYLLYKDEIEKRFGFELPDSSRFQELEEEWITVTNNDRISDERMAISAIKKEQVPYTQKDRCLNPKLVNKKNAPKAKVFNLDGHKKGRLFKAAEQEFISLYPTREAAFTAWAKRPLHKRSVRELTKPAVEGGDRLLYEACKYFGIKVPSRQYYNVHAVYAALMEVPETNRNYKALKRKVEDGGNPNLLKWTQRYAEQLKDIYGFTLKTDIKHGAYDTAEKVYNALMSIPETERSVKFLQRAKSEGGNRTLLRQYAKFEEEIKIKFNYSLPRQNRKSKEYKTMQQTYKALMSLPAEHRSVECLSKPLKEGGDWRLLRAYRKFRQKLYDTYGFELKRNTQEKYATVHDVYAAVMQIPREHRTAWHLDRSNREGGNRTLLKALRKFKKELKEKYGFKLDVIEQIKYPDAEAVYNAIMQRPEEERTVKSLKRNIDIGGNRNLLSAYYKFEKEIQETFGFTLERERSKYSTAEEVYEAIMARSPDERSRLSLDRTKKDGGDRWLLKKIRKFAKELKEKYNFSLSEEKNTRPFKYPTVQDVYEAMMARPREARKVSALKAPKKNGGDYALLAAYYRFRSELKEEFGFVMAAGRSASKYLTADQAYKAVMARPEKERTAKSLDRTNEEGGDRQLLKALRKFRKQLVKKYGFTMPLEKRKRTARLQTPQQIYTALMARKPHERTRKSLRQKKEDGGDATLLKKYDQNKAEIKKEFGFELPKEPQAERLYPSKESAFAALSRIPEEDRTPKRLDELGYYSLRKACYKFGIELHKKEKVKIYATRAEVLKALQELPVRERTSTRLRRPVAEGGNPLLLKRSWEFGVQLPKEEAMRVYPTYESAQKALMALPEDLRYPSKLVRQPALGGNPLLLHACLDHDVELPRDIPRYSTKRLTLFMLNRRPPNMRTPKMLLKKQTEGGDHRLYSACSKFNIELPKTVLAMRYPTAEDTYKALISRPERDQTYTRLKLPKDQGGDPTLYKAYKRFRRQLKEKYGYVLKNEPLGKYKTREDAIAALNARAPEDRTCVKLQQRLEDGGDAALYNACLKFDIKLPLFAAKTGRRYPTKKDAIAALMKRPLEKRFASELIKLVSEGGDPSLYNACCEFDILLPKKIRPKIYPTADITYKELMKVPVEERTVSKLSRSKNRGGNPALVTAYYTFRAELKTQYNFEMPHKNNKSYSDKKAALAALNKRPAEERTYSSLKRPYSEGGNRALLKACREFEIELPKGTPQPLYPDAESVYKALKQRKAKHNTYNMLIKPKAQGGNHTLLIAYTKFKDEILERFNYQLPKAAIKNKNKYLTARAAIEALEARPSGSRTRSSLLQKVENGGDWALYAACKRFGIPLEKQEPEMDGYERYRRKILEQSTDIERAHIMELWHSAQEQQSQEKQAALSMVVAYFTHRVIELVENRNGSNDPSRDVSGSRGEYYSALVSAANLALVEAVYSWNLEMQQDFFTYVDEKIKEAIRKERAGDIGDRYRFISLSQPSGNKGGDNSFTKSGPFGGSSKRTLEDSFEDTEQLPAIDILEKFEKMKKVIQSFRNGDYSFIKSVAADIDEIDVEIDEDLLVSKETKQKFKEALYRYFDEKGILKAIPGKFGIWIMGSMGQIGIARKGLSDVNILIVTEAPVSECKNAIMKIRNLIGSGLIETGKDGNFILTIGKENEYFDMVFNSADFVSLMDSFELGNAEEGLASIEIMSLQQLKEKDNRSLYRAQFHVLENLCQMGENGIMVAEAYPGVVDEISARFKGNSLYPSQDYLFFMNEYLMKFFNRQISNLIEAHKFCGQEKVAIKNQLREVEDQESLSLQTQEGFYGKDAFLGRKRKQATFDGEEIIKLGNAILYIKKEQEAISISIGKGFNKSLNVYNYFWHSLLRENEGKVIYLDDPSPQEEENCPRTLVLLERQTDELKEHLEKEIQFLFGDTQSMEVFDADVCSLSPKAQEHNRDCAEEMCFLGESIADSFSVFSLDGENLIARAL